MSSPVGTLLARRYRLELQVGSGGMSTVYRAFDTTLERQVAVKVMHREIAADADQLERFRREARAVAQLNHPHIVQVIDAGQDDDPDRPLPFIVFEYVEGETLKARIRRAGRLPVAEAVAYAIEIARALAAAHERGIVHRDVKPQNVLVDEQGSAKVTDFGIARNLEQDGLTADGRVLGTTDYVSPEQALGHPVTGQSDIYSLGVVLFEMLTGEVPFKGESQVTVAMKHVREDLPDVQHRRPEISSALAAVVDRATDKELLVRYRDDATLIADLEDVLAMEAARTGQMGGEATAVFRTLPETKRRRVPGFVQHPRRIFALLALVGCVVAVVLLVLAQGHGTTVQRGTSNARGVPRAPGETAVSLGQGAAHDYDPAGDRKEHPDEARAISDDNRKTSWTTERYRNGVFAGPKGVKDGVGIYLDADPSARVTRMDIRTSTPGWGATVYGSNSPPSGTWPSRDWKGIGDIVGATRHTVVPLSGERYRYYLLWLQSLPKGAQQVSISEITMVQRTPG